MPDYAVKMILWKTFDISYLMFSGFPGTNFAVNVSKGRQNVWILSTQMETF